MRKDRITELLKAHLKDIQGLELIDESHQHAGRKGQESHFKLLLVSQDFEGLSRVARQRLVQDWLKAEFNQGLHALSLRLLTWDEAKASGTTFQSPPCAGGDNKS